MTIAQKPAEFNLSFRNRVMSLWDQKLDTAEIAKQLRAKESDVAMALHIGRETRRKHK